MPKGHNHRNGCRCGYCKALAGPPKRRRKKRTKAKGGKR